MILVIAGMHRSGTSLFASWLQDCGMVIHNGNSIAPYPDNPNGFFEDRDFVRLHVQSIRRRAPLSSGWKIAPSYPLTFSDSEIQMADNLIMTRQGSYSTWGWKDPRTTLFLDQWKRLIPQLKVAIVWRPCDQVVFSLLRRWRSSRTRRHYLDPIWAIRLWQAHNRLACDFAANYPDDTHVISITQVVTHDRPLLESLNQKFGASLVFVPIQARYQPGQINEKPPPCTIHLLCKAMGCRRDEARLLSFTPQISKITQ